MRWLAALLTWFAADPQAIDDERPRAAACVQAAHASLHREIREDDDDAAKNQNTEAAVGGASESGSDGKGVSSGSRLPVEGSQSVETGCADGRCVDVQRVRSSRKR